MATVQELERLKKSVERRKSEIDQAKGARDEGLRSLKKDFKVSSLKDGKALLKSIIEKEEKQEEEFNTALEEWKEVWEEELDGT